MAQSKKETEDFIIAKCRWSDGEMAQEVILDGPDTARRLIVKRLKRPTEGKYTLWIDAALIRDLNPNRVEAKGAKRPPYPVDAFATSGDRVKYSYGDVASKDAMRKYPTPEKLAAALRESVSDISYLPFSFRDERTAKQVAKALTHLIKLYGGKEELFEP